MKFYVVKRKTMLPPAAKYPCVLLVPDSWNDFGFQTLFHLFWQPRIGTTREIGDVKILELGALRTVLPSSFLRLNRRRYCSLGQTLEYYKNVKDLGRRESRDLLRCLSDTAINPIVSARFKNEEGFEKSLLRFSEAEKAYKEARSIFGKKIRKAKFKFLFKCRVQGAAGEHAIEFDFQRVNRLPNRIFALVGKNGTGKTQILAHLATTLSGFDETGEILPARPAFSRVMAISYSAFDRFAKPMNRRSFSYRYFGITEGQKLIRPEILSKKLRAAYRLIKRQHRQAKWAGILKEIIPSDVMDAWGYSLKKNGPAGLVAPNGNSVLSSGHSFLLLVLTQVIANIRNDSLILYDEPEMHLHPNAVANLIRALHKLLREFKSYAVVGTHSPSILQEIPARHIRVLYRQGNIPIVKPPPLETFGENLSTITENVFDTVSVEGTYKEVLDSLARRFKYKEVLDMFNGKLSLNARSYLRGAYLGIRK